MQRKQKNTEQWVTQLMELSSNEQFPVVSKQFSDNLVSALINESELKQVVKFNGVFYLKAATVLAIVALNIFTLLQVFQNDNTTALKQQPNTERELLISQLESEYFVSDANIWESYE